MAKIEMTGELRSERMATLITPTIKADLTKVAMVNRTSVNDIVNNALSAYLKEHQEEVLRYNAFFGEE